jgi:hypothetical protein
MMKQLDTVSTSGRAPDAAQRRPQHIRRRVDRTGDHPVRLARGSPSPRRRRAGPPSPRAPPPPWRRGPCAARSRARYGAVADCLLGDVHDLHPVERHAVPRSASAADCAPACPPARPARCRSSVDRPRAASIIRSSSASGSAIRSCRDRDTLSLIRAITSAMSLTFLLSQVVGLLSGDPSRQSPAA